MPRALLPRMASRQVSGHGPRKDWTKGSIIGNLWQLSWPMMVHEIFYTGTHFIDMIWVGKLGAVSVAGVGVSAIVVGVAQAMVLGLVVGMRAMVARFVGAGDESSANNIARQALITSAVFGAVITAIGILFAAPMLNLLLLKADVISVGAVYMRVIFAGWVSYSLWLAAFGMMQASGDTVTPLKITVFIRSVQVVLAPFLIFGWWFFPRLGVVGAATATITAQTLAISLALWVLFSGRTRLRLTLRGFRPDPNMIWRIVKIGLPAAVMGIQRSLGGLVLTRFIAPFGTVAIAAHSLVNRVELMLFLPSGQVSSGAGVLVAQNLGAGQPGRAERSGWLAVGFVQAIMLVASVAIWLWAEGIIRIFNTEPALVEVASIFLRIAIAGYLVTSFSQSLQQAISGSGDTIPPMLISLVMIWLVQLPLAFLLPRVSGLGVYGVRWAIVAGLVVGGIAYVVYFQMGRWKHKKV
ncbi:MAG: MATE family efflux transporter [Chloroflexi bacterium]|nr:MATE family efflux transporter [Chloroflexota bacterium]